MISDKEMSELRPLVIATFENCNTPNSEKKIDVLERCFQFF
jgi:hypothetical protein